MNTYQCIFVFKIKINIKISHDINNSHESTGFITTNYNRQEVNHVTIRTTASAGACNKQGKTKPIYNTRSGCMFRSAMSLLESR